VLHTRLFSKEFLPATGAAENEDTCNDCSQCNDGTRKQQVIVPAPVEPQHVKIVTPIEEQSVVEESASQESPVSKPLGRLRMKTPAMTAANVTMAPGSSKSLGTPAINCFSLQILAFVSFNLDIKHPEIA
jgi:hypothetical protein